MKVENEENEEGEGGEGEGDREGERDGEQHGCLTETDPFVSMTSNKVEPRFLTHRYSVLSANPSRPV